MNEILKINKVINDTNFNIVSIKPPGKYLISHFHEPFWNLYCNFVYFNKGFVSLAERRQRFYSMLTLDFDYEQDYDKKDDKKEIKELYKITDVKFICEKLLKTILPNLLNVADSGVGKIKRTNLSLTLLTKKPYISGKKIKHGFHLQSLCLFPNKETRLAIFEEIKKYNDHIDKGSVNNPWLLYGSSKNETSGKYEVNKTFMLDKFGNLICVNTDNYIKKHVKIFNDKGNLINYKNEIRFYYPLVFLCDRLFGGNLSKSKDINYIECNLLKKIDIEIKNQISMVRKECDNESVFKIVQDYINRNSNGEFNINRYIQENGFFIIKRKCKGCCLVSNEEHSRVNSWGFELNGSIIIGCYSKKCKGISKVLKEGIKKRIYSPKKETTISFMLDE